MYYEEAIINGVWCRRGSPTGEWVPFTLRELSLKFDDLQMASRESAMRFMKERDEWREVAQKLFECELLWVESFADEDLVDREDHAAMRAYRALVERENYQPKESK